VIEIINRQIEVSKPFGYKIKSNFPSTFFDFEIIIVIVIVMHAHAYIMQYVLRKRKLYAFSSIIDFFHYPIPIDLRLCVTV
jgi:hypothetical protein